jgi:hypothetical protein
VRWCFDGKWREWPAEKGRLWLNCEIVGIIVETVGINVKVVGISTSRVGISVRLVGINDDARGLLKKGTLNYSDLALSMPKHMKFQDQMRVQYNLKRK